MHCPEGQLYSHLGKCIFPSKIWLNKVYTILINLTTKLPINEVDFQFIRSNFIARNWPNAWYFTPILWQYSTSDQEYINLLVFSYNIDFHVRPQVLMQTVKKMIHRDWILYIANKTYTFASKFNLNIYLPEHLPLFTYKGQPVFQNQFEKSHSYIGIYYNPSFDIQKMVQNLETITKLFVCNQVELEPNEFILDSMGTLFNNITNNYLLLNEFQLFTKTSGNETARVCIEDSGFIGMTDKFDESSSVDFLYSFVIEVITMLIIKSMEYIFIRD
jgi:hypothetical protein